MTAKEKKALDEAKALGEKIKYDNFVSEMAARGKKRMEEERLAKKQAARKSKKEMKDAQRASKVEVVPVQIQKAVSIDKLDNVIEHVYNHNDGGEVEPDGTLPLTGPVTCPVVKTNTIEGPTGSIDLIGKWLNQESAGLSDQFSAFSNDFNNPNQLLAHFTPGDIYADSNFETDISKNMLDTPFQASNIPKHLSGIDENLVRGECLVGPGDSLATNGEEEANESAVLLSMIKVPSDGNNSNSSSSFLPPRRRSILKTQEADSEIPNTTSEGGVSGLLNIETDFTNEISNTDITVTVPENQTHSPGRGAAVAVVQAVSALTSPKKSPRAS